MHLIPALDPPSTPPPPVTPSFLPSRPEPAVTPTLTWGPSTSRLSRTELQSKSGCYLIYKGRKGYYLFYFQIIHTTLDCCWKTPPGTFIGFRWEIHSPHSKY